MSEVVCSTSPLQYPHQLGLLHILPALAGRVIVPPAVIVRQGKLPQCGWWPEKKDEGRSVGDEASMAEISITTERKS
ncbi:MAG: hypothetical protein HYV60_08195 [Planctomycetia bacterium]|nr:hypothetical protein [Planctomycetia bacterium]